MAGAFTKVFSFTFGAVRTSEYFYFAMVSPELRARKVDHSYVALRNKNEWGAEEDPRSWNTVGIAVVSKPVTQGIFVGAWGDAVCSGSKDLHDEKIQDGEQTPRVRGPLMGARAVDGKAYAVGMARQVYRRDGRDQWTCIDQGMAVPKESDDIAGLQSIDGFSEKDLYAAGLGGEIWHYNGKKWSQIDSPTNVPLTWVCCGGDGKVYVGGRTGILLRGRGEEWEKIDHEATGEDLWGGAWLHDRLFLSSMKAIYILEDQKLKPVDFGDETPETFYHLDAREGVLLSTGPRDLMLYDGKTWTRID